MSNILLITLLSSYFQQISQFLFKSTEQGMRGVNQECKFKCAEKIRLHHEADDKIYCWHIIRSTLYYSVITKINISLLLTKTGDNTQNDKR